jgi:hypothetical protein
MHPTPRTYNLGSKGPIPETPLLARKNLVSRKVSAPAQNNLVVPQLKYAPSTTMACKISINNHFLQPMEYNIIKHMKNTKANVSII